MSFITKPLTPPPSIANISGVILLLSKISYYFYSGSSHIDKSRESYAETKCFVNWGQFDSSYKASCSDYRFVDNIFHDIKLYFVGFVTSRYDESKTSSAKIKWMSDKAVPIYPRCIASLSSSSSSVDKLLNP